MEDLKRALEEMEFTAGEIKKVIDSAATALEEHVKGIAEIRAQLERETWVRG